MSVRTHELSVDADMVGSAAELLKTTLGTGEDWTLRRADLDPHVAGLIEAVLRAIAQGESLSIGRVPDVLTTTTAAAMLGVSRPTLMKHVRSGALPSHMVGTHTRLHRVDVEGFKRKLKAERAEAVQKLMELEDELNEPL